MSLLISEQWCCSKHVAAAKSRAVQRAPACRLKAADVRTLSRSATEDRGCRIYARMARCEPTQRTDTAIVWGYPEVCSHRAKTFWVSRRRGSPDSPIWSLQTTNRHFRQRFSGRKCLATGQGIIGHILQRACAPQGIWAAGQPTRRRGRFHVDDRHCSPSCMPRSWPWGSLTSFLPFRLEPMCRLSPRSQQSRSSSRNAFSWNSLPQLAPRFDNTTTPTLPTPSWYPSADFDRRRAIGATGTHRDP